MYEINDKKETRVGQVWNLLAKGKGIIGSLKYSVVYCVALEPSIYHYICQKKIKKLDPNKQEIKKVNLTNYICQKKAK